MNDPAAKGTTVSPALAARLRVAALPMAVLLVICVLTALNLNGSSVAALAGPTGWAADPHLVAGAPQAVRGDEYLYSTPAQAGNVAKGFPASTWLGLTDTVLPATSLDPPVLSWIALFKPQTWGMFVLGAEHGYALFWWLLFGVGILGAYALLLALRPRPWLAAVVAVTVGLSPLAAQWTSAGPGLVLGYLCGAAASAIWAARAVRWWIALLLGALAGYLAACAFLVLYPAWVVSCALVVAAVTFGAWWDSRVAPLRAVAASALAAVTAVVPLAFWYWQSRDALAAILGTYYPGRRISGAGEGMWQVLLDAPLSPVFARGQEALALSDTVNQNEVAAPWLPLPALLALTCLAFWTYWRTRPTARVAVYGSGLGALTTTTAMCALLLAWVLAPLPAIAGAITLLNRVPANRATLALGLAAAVLLYLVAGRIHLVGRGAALAGVLLAASAVAAILVLPAVAAALVAPGVRWEETAYPLAALVVLCAIVLALDLPRLTRVAAGTALVAVAAGCFALVNPLYQGLGPLTQGELADTAAAMAAREGPSRWVALGPSRLSSVLAASPNEVLSGMTYYPDPAVWARLDSAQERIWNNFSVYTWEYSAYAMPAFLEATDSGRSAILHVQICSPELDFLGIRYVVMRQDAPRPLCLTPVTEVHDLGLDLEVLQRTPTSP